MELKEKTAIVTGAGRGIGAGIALALAREGAHVVVNDMNMGDASSVAKKIESMGRKADVTSKSEIGAMITETLKQFGTIDILVNNAGIEGPPHQLKDIPEEQWDHVQGVNLKGAFLCCQAVIPTMLEHRHGKIVNIASTAAERMSFFGGADYTASKHGLAGLSKLLAFELAIHGINVNVVCPGAVLTPLAEGGTTQELRDFLTGKLIPLGRWCTPDDIAEAVVFLASERSSLITGHLLDVEGGLLLGFGNDMRREVIERKLEEMKASDTSHP